MSNRFWVSGGEKENVAKERPQSRGGKKHETDTQSNPALITLKIHSAGE